MKKTTSDEFDIEALCMSVNGNPGAEALAELAARPKRMFGKQDGLYFRMPLSWLLAGADCGPGVGKVGGVLWVRSGIMKHKTIEFSLRQYAQIAGISRGNVHGAFHRLARAGLVVFDGEPRRRLTVTVIERKPSA
jgi:hypothetical protein